MVVLTTGYSVRCILWEQEAIFNKGMFLCGLQLFALNTFCDEYLQLSLLFFVVFLCCKYPQKVCLKDVSINNYKLLNTQACSFRVTWNKGCTQSLVLRCK